MNEKNKTNIFYLINYLTNMMIWKIVFEDFSLSASFIGIMSFIGMPVLNYFLRNNTKLHVNFFFAGFGAGVGYLINVAHAWLRTIF